MARLAKQSTTWSDDDDDFPDLDALVSSKKLQAQVKEPKANRKQKARSSTGETLKPATTIRRRKLGPLTDNLLLRAWTPDSTENILEETHVPQEKELSKPRRTRVELRTRNTRPAVVVPSSPADREDEYVSAQEEVTIIEDVSMFDDTFHSCASEGSEFNEEDEDDVFGAATPPRRTPAKPRLQGKNRKSSGRTKGDASSERRSAFLTEEEDESQPALNRGASRRQDSESQLSIARKGEGKANRSDKDLADTLSKLRL
jgi:hypothetical protein